MALSPDELDALRRNSKLRIDKEGRWWLDRHLVENERVQTLFHKCLSKDDATERLMLTVGTQWAYVQTVDDTAWFISRVQVDATGCRLMLADGTKETLDPTSLSMASDTDVYCVIGGNRRARFLRTALIDLAPYLEETTHGIGIRLGTVVYDIRME